MNHNIRLQRLELIYSLFRQGDVELLSQLLRRNKLSITNETARELGQKISWRESVIRDEIMVNCSARSDHFNHHKRTTDASIYCYASE